MSFNALMQLLDQGLDSDTIVATLQKASPKIARKVRQMLLGGYGTSEILKHLKNDPKLSDNLKMPKHAATPAEIARLAIIQNKMEVPKSRDQQERESLRKITPYVITAASMALPFVAPEVMGALRGVSGASNLMPSPAEPQPITTQVPQPTIQPGNNIGQQISPAPQPAMSPIITRASLQPTVAPSQPTLSSSQILQTIGQLQRATNLLQAGNPPETVAAAINSLMKGDERKAFGEMLKSGQTKPLIEMVKDVQLEMQQKQPAPQPIQPQPEPIQHQPVVPEPEQPLPPQETMLAPEEALPEPEPEKPIEKKSIVATPHGVGEVKAISGDQAIVEIDGKAKKVPLEDIEQEPEDIVQTVQQLLKIPEVDRSSIVSLFTYDPAENKMYIQYHTGDTYKYLDVDPEKVMKVANKMGIPVTQGQNIFGAWSPEDKQSLGATLIKEIINDPKYKKPKKGEAANPNYVKLETLYDYWEKLRKKPKKKKK